MNEIIAGFLLLLPALLTLIALIGVPVAAGVLVFPYLREHLSSRHPVAARVLHAGNRRSGRDRRRHHARGHHHHAAAV